MEKLRLQEGGWKVQLVVPGGKELKPSCLTILCLTILDYLCCTTLSFSSFTPKQRQDLFYEVHSFISHSIFYCFLPPSIKFLKSSSNTTLVWKLPFFNIYIYCILLVSQKNYKIIQKVTKRLHFKSTEVCNILSAHMGFGIWLIKEIISTLYKI